LRDRCAVRSPTRLPDHRDRDRDLDLLIEIILHLVAV
jgi:hypothetical protein